MDPNSPPQFTEEGDDVPPRVPRRQGDSGLGASLASRRATDVSHLEGMDLPPEEEEEEDYDEEEEEEEEEDQEGEEEEEAEEEEEDDDDEEKDDSAGCGDENDQGGDHDEDEDPDGDPQGGDGDEEEDEEDDQDDQYEDEEDDEEEEDDDYFEDDDGYYDKDVAVKSLKGIPAYEGEDDPLAARNFLSTLEWVGKGGKWNSKQIAVALKLRTRGVAAQWHRSMELSGVDLTSYHGCAEKKNKRGEIKRPGRPSLKQLFLIRFGSMHDQHRALRELSRLVQEKHESCADYMDKVLLALLLRDLEMNEGTKRSSEYRAQFSADLRKWFIAGLRPIFRQKLVVASPPLTSMDEILSVLHSLESDLSIASSQQENVNKEGGPRKRGSPEPGRVRSGLKERKAGQTGREETRRYESGRWDERNRRRRYY